MEENKMGVLPERRLLLSMSLPIMLSMLVQALYNVVDSIFVAQFSQDALTGVTVAFPMQNLMIAVGGGTGVGISAFLSKSLGEKKNKLASDVAKNGLILGIFSWLAFVLIGLFAVRPFIAGQTDVPAVIDYGTEYLTICSVLSFGIFGQLILERILQATGKTVYSMLTQIVGAVINIILDPILIFGYFGFPRMGIAGAAAATVTGQIIAMIVALLLNIRKNKELDFSFRGFRPSGAIIRRIYAVGIPSIVMMAISSVMTFAMNSILGAFSTAATNVFGVYFKLQSFAVMPIFGLNNGMIPIISYNYGAKKRERIQKTIRLALFSALLIMAAAIAVFQLFPSQLIGLFETEGADNTQLYELGTNALRVLSLNFIFAGFCIVLSAVFQALGNGVLSLIVSAARQLVVLIPVAYLLSLLGDVHLIWWAFPIAELASLLCCVGCYVYIHKRIIRNIPGSEVL